ncbi:hypothetical protein ABZX69_06240 [Streptomyces sp. NPDC004074]
MAGGAACGVGRGRAERVFAVAHGTVARWWEQALYEEDEEI